MLEFETIKKKCRKELDELNLTENDERKVVNDLIYLSSLLLSQCNVKLKENSDDG